MQIKKIFTVIDPSSDNQAMLERVARTARSQQAKVVAFCCVYSNLATTQIERLIKAELHRYRLWLDDITAPLKEQGIEVEYMLEWDMDWKDRLVEAVRQTDADIIVKNSYSNQPHESQRLAKSVDRSIIRVAKVPVVLLRRENPIESGVIIAALKTGELDAAHKRVNDAIIGVCNTLVANNPKFQVHAVTVYSGSDSFVYPEDVAKIAGLPRNHGHSYDSNSPVRGIQEMARQLNAELVVIGSVARKGVAGRLLGSSAEQLLDGLDSDLIVLTSPED